MPIGSKKCLSYTLLLDTKKLRLNCNVSVENFQGLTNDLKFPEFSTPSSPRQQGSTVCIYSVICFFSDIQEFYEYTLLDDTKSTQQKTLETLQIANKWEREPPITNAHPKSEVRLNVYRQ